MNAGVVAVQVVDKAVGPVEGVLRHQVGSVDVQPELGVALTVLSFEKPLGKKPNWKLKFEVGKASVLLSPGIRMIISLLAPYNRVFQPSRLKTQTQNSKEFRA